jgi:hypothetical protein
LLWGNKKKGGGLPKSNMEPIRWRIVWARVGIIFGKGVDHRWATLIMAKPICNLANFFAFDTLMRTFKCFHNLANSLVSEWTSKKFRFKSNCQSKVFFWKPKLKNHQFQAYEIKIKEPPISWKISWKN